MSIINDTPINARSCFVYEKEVLKTYGGDFRYPLPEENHFNQCRKLNSLEAVKEIGPGKTVFSHMYVSPEDVEMIFEEEFMSTLKDIQTDVSLFCCLTAFKLVGMGSYKKSFEKYPRLKPNRDGHSSYTLGQNKTK